MRGLPVVALISSAFLSVACARAKAPNHARAEPHMTAAVDAIDTARAMHETGEAVRSVDGGGLVLSDQVRKACPGVEPPRFGTDSADIRVEWKNALQALAHCMRHGGLRGQTLLLTGHTDPRGDDDYNLALGGRRADAVKRALVQWGVAETRIETTSRGEVDAKGTDEASWEKDRRVEIDVAPRARAAHAHADD